MRYSGHPLPMLVASLNSHLYYLSASKSARASPEPPFLLYRFFLPAVAPAVPLALVVNVATRARVPLDAYKEVASLPVRNASGTHAGVTMVGVRLMRIFFTPRGA